MARPNPFETKKSIAGILNKFVANPDSVSYDHKRKLAAQEYLTFEKQTSENVKHAGRGRKSHVYGLTGKAKGLLNLAKNWKTAA